MTKAFIPGAERRLLPFNPPRSLSNSPSPVFHRVPDLHRHFYGPSVILPNLNPCAHPGSRTGCYRTGARCEIIITNANDFIAQTNTPL
nr:hypothetical protein [Escherichia coli]